MPANGTGHTTTNFARKGLFANFIEKWGRLSGIFVALGLSLIFLFISLSALQRADKATATIVEIPLIRAKTGPAKIKPDDPGGLKIPNQDKLVFERITPAPPPEIIEKLAPEPEEPIVDRINNYGHMAALNFNSHTKDLMLGQKYNTALGDVAKFKSREKLLSPGAKTSETKVLKKQGSSKHQRDQGTFQTNPSENYANISRKIFANKEINTKINKSEIENKGYKIQFAAYREAKQADTAWRRIQKTHKKLLGSAIGFTARVDLGKRGIFYRAQAGFFASKASAQSICSELKSKKQDCIIVSPF